MIGPLTSTLAYQSQLVGQNDKENTTQRVLVPLTSIIDGLPMIHDSAHPWYIIPPMPDVQLDL